MIAHLYSTIIRSIGVLSMTKSVNFYINIYCAQCKVRSEGYLRREKEGSSRSFRAQTRILSIVSDLYLNKLFIHFIVI